MKKLSTFILIMVLALSMLTACGGNGVDREEYDRIMDENSQMREELGEPAEPDESTGNSQSENESQTINEKENDPQTNDTVENSPSDDFPETPASDFRYEDFQGGLTIRGYNGTDTKIRIPEEIDGVAVLGIHGLAFENSEVLEIHIPDSVTSFGSTGTFADSKLQSIIIPDGVTSIPYAAFSNCQGLNSIILGSGVTSIGELAFRGCIGLTSIDIPDSVTKIDRAAFHGCVKLSSVTFKGETYNFDASRNDFPEGLYVASGAIPPAQP